MPLEMSRGSTPATPQVAEVSGATVGVAWMYCSNGLACAAGAMPRARTATALAATALCLSRAAHEVALVAGCAAVERDKKWRRVERIPNLSAPFGYCKRKSAIA